MGPVPDFIGTVLHLWACLVGWMHGDLRLCRRLRLETEHGPVTGRWQVVPFNKPTWVCSTKIGGLNSSARSEGEQALDDKRTMHIL